jgi:predicted RNA-binding protein YlxR (DUF448 family)
LLRVVAILQGADLIVAAPDPTRTRLGRGAHLHPDPACLALAERRRAFGRALRVTGVVDTGPLAELLAPLGKPGEAIASPDSKVGRPA